MLQSGSPFDNSNNRSEVDMVVTTLRKISGGDVEIVSPLPLDEKKVNISNLSDLMPEDL